jgi:hypothetical protein
LLDVPTSPDQSDRLVSPGCRDDALGGIVNRQGLWAATGAGIIDRYPRARPV